MYPSNVLTVTALASSLVYLVSLGLSLRKLDWQSGRVHLEVARTARIYAGLSLVWALLVASQAWWRPALLERGIGSLPFSLGLLVLSIALFLLTWAIFEAEISPWPWLAAGTIWVVVNGILAVSLAAAYSWVAFYLAVAGWGLYTGAAMVLTGQALRQPARFYTLVCYWAVVFMFCVLGDSLAFSGYLALGTGLHTLGAALAIYVAVSPRLTELDRPGRSLSGYMLLTSIAILIFTAVMGLTYVLLNTRRWGSPLLIGLILALLIVFVLMPLLRRVQRHVDDLAEGTGSDMASVLRQYSQSITNTVDLNLLSTLAVGTASEFLELSRGFLFLVENERRDAGETIVRLRGVKGMGTVNPETGFLAENSPLVQYLRNENKPVTRAEIDSGPLFQGLAEQERQWLASLGAEIYIPICSKNEWVGLLVLGPKGDGRPYSPSNVAFLRTLADQTAVAMENTRLVEGLVRLNNEFRRAYAALDQANRHLERLDNTKSNFISIASHELRTPLTLISGSTQMLLDEPMMQENAYYQQLLSKINTGTIRLHEVVESMLDMAMLDMHTLELEHQRTPIGSLIQIVLNDLAKEAQARKLDLEVRGLDNLPAVMADAPALRKVFYHLIINAIKYTPDGGSITISGSLVEANSTDLPSGGVEIVVADTGIGIDSRYQELIFAKFYQTGELALHSSGKTKFKGGGPGLGLAIAKGIVEAHQGKLWVESPGYDEEKCPGSQFHVIIPLRPIGRVNMEAESGLLVGGK